MISNQSDIHPELSSVTRRHIVHPFLKPISPSQQDAYQKVRKFWEKLGRPKTILDVGCGTGLSTLWLAKQHPDILVIGIDPSFVRLAKSPKQLENMCLIRARAEEFWLQMFKDDWRPAAMTFFYPNPWPKKKHLQRRWHAHPIWPQIMRWRCPMILRTNWEIYAREWHFVCGTFSLPATINRFEPVQPLTRFEAKYQASGHTLFQVNTDLKDMLKLASTVTEQPLY